MLGSPLRIGVSSCLFHEDAARPVFHGKPLHYVESSMVRWVSSADALVYVIPPWTSRSLGGESYARDIDGLILQGGVDVSPSNYGEAPLKPEWSGDPVRDAYELELLRAMIALQKPVLGVCRGHQLINVAMGGSLYQDIATQLADAGVHRHADTYDRLHHTIDIDPSSTLSRLYGGLQRAHVNTVHHQAIHRLGEGVIVEATSTEDGVIEAIVVPGQSYLRGVQWHPEFAFTMNDPPVEFLDGAPLLRDFTHAANLRRERG